MIRLILIVFLLYFIFWSWSPEGQQWLVAQQASYTKYGVRSFIEPVWCGQEKCLSNQGDNPPPQRK